VDRGDAGHRGTGSARDGVEQSSGSREPAESQPRLRGGLCRNHGTEHNASRPDQIQPGRNAADAGRAGQCGDGHGIDEQPGESADDDQPEIAPDDRQRRRAGAEKGDRIVWREEASVDFAEPSRKIADLGHSGGQPGAGSHGAVEVRTKRRDRGHRQQRRPGWPGDGPAEVDQRRAFIRASPRECGNIGQLHEEVEQGRARQRGEDRQWQGPLRLFRFPGRNDDAFKSHERVKGEKHAGFEVGEGGRRTWVWQWHRHQYGGNGDAEEREALEHGQPAEQADSALRARNIDERKHRTDEQDERDPDGAVVGRSPPASKIGREHVGVRRERHHPREII